MIGSVIAGVAALLMAVAMPMVLLSPVEIPEEPKLLVIEAEQPRQSEITVKLQTGQAMKELPLEEYLIGVVLSEMPMSFEQEALKAQAVAARTFAMGQLDNGKHRDFDLCGQSSCCQAWTGEEMLARKLGNSWQAYWEKASAAVESTEGQVLTYDGELIDAVYFSCSGGMTEDAVAVWGGDVPYLRSVESPGEEQAGKFHTMKEFSREDFCEIILQARPLTDLSGRAEGWIGKETRTEGGGIAEITIGGCTFKGTEIRQLFGLNSTNFTVETENERVIFSVYGYGHRVGMSQYGANAMAAEGKNYKEILCHYYDGVKVEKR